MAKSYREGAIIEEKLQRRTCLEDDYLLKRQTLGEVDTSGIKSQKNFFKNISENS